MSPILFIFNNRFTLGRIVDFQKNLEKYSAVGPSKFSDFGKCLKTGILLNNWKKLNKCKNLKILHINIYTSYRLRQLEFV